LKTLASTEVVLLLVRPSASRRYQRGPLCVKFVLGDFVKISNLRFGYSWANTSGRANSVLLFQVTNCHKSALSERIFSAWTLYHMVIPFNALGSQLVL